MRSAHFFFAEKIRVHFRCFIFAADHLSVHPNGAARQCIGINSKLMYVFVYGTLLTTIPSSMSKFLRRRGQLVGKASVAGTLYDLGMYPGLRPGGEGRVKGELYRLIPETAAETMTMLDAYEGITGESEDEYRKIEVAVQVDDGGVFRATTYEYTGATEGKSVVPRGDYGGYFVGNAAHERFVNGE